MKKTTERIHKIVVFPALSSPNTRMRASLSPKSAIIREKKRPIVAE